MTADVIDAIWEGVERQAVIDWLESPEGERWSRAFHAPVTSHVRQRRGATSADDWFVPLAEVYGGTKHSRNPNAHPWDQSRFHGKYVNASFDPTQGGTP